MGIIGNLAQTKNIPIVDDSGIELVAREDVLDLVQVCCENSIFVLGLDGFKLEGNLIISFPDAIADFSSLIQDRKHSKRIELETIKFLRDVKEDVQFFEIIVDGT